MSTAFLYHTETMAGTEIQKPLPGRLHAIVQMYLLTLLNDILPEGFLVLPELNVVCTGERIVPDLTIYQQDARFVDDGDLADSPSLAIEIASPGQTFSNLLGKCEQLVEAGTPMTWIIIPKKREGWMFSAEGLKQEMQSLRSDAVEISLADMWAAMDKKNQVS